MLCSHFPPSCGHLRQARLLVGQRPLYLFARHVGSWVLGAGEFSLQHSERDEWEHTEVIGYFAG